MLWIVNRHSCLAKYCENYIPFAIVFSNIAPGHATTSTLNTAKCEKKTVPGKSWLVCRPRFTSTIHQNLYRETRLAPLPKQLTFVKNYNFFAEIPEHLIPFAYRISNFPDFPDKAKITTSTQQLDKDYYNVTIGTLNNIPVVLKPTIKSQIKTFYAFLNSAKEKLVQLAADGDDTPPEEDEKFWLKYKPLVGLRHISPIVGIAKMPQKIANLDRWRGKWRDNAIAILPLVPGNTLENCIDKKLPPYDTPYGLPRNKTIAIDLCLHFIRACTTLHVCCYTHNDCNLRNVIITKKGPSFSLKLIDWGNLKEIESKSDEDHIIGEICKLILAFLLGSHLENFNNKKTNEENFSVLTHLYSPRFITFLKQLLSYRPSANQPDVSLKTFLCRFEKLLLDEKRLENEEEL